MLKKIIVLISCLILIISTVGCGKKNIPETQVNANDFNFDFASSQSSTPTESNAETDETVSDDKFSGSINDNSSSETTQSDNSYSSDVTSSDKENVSSNKLSSKVAVSSSKVSSKKNSANSKTSSKINTSANKTSSKANSTSSKVSTQATVSSNNTSSKNNSVFIEDIFASSAISSSTSSKNTSSKAECKHTYTTADCEQPEECTLCGNIKSKPLGHKFENNICSVCGATPLEWYTKDISITKEEVEQILSAQYKKPKNVIMMIGDGMGPNDIAYTEKNASNCYDFGLVLNQIKNTGFSTTRSASSAITDSAASGTALATGFKTSNGSVGVTVTGDKLTNISEIAREYGKKVGIVTNDDIVGATPSAFAVHFTSRDKYDYIAKLFVKFEPDVLIGQGISYFAPLNLNRFVVAKDFSKFNEALNSNIKCNRPFLGFFNENVTSSSSDINTLAYCTQVALNRLKKNSPNGFFLMVENTTCDNAGHAENLNGKMRGVVMLDRAVATVLKFMKDNPDTLLIITSDHDNGNITMNGEFTQLGHSGIDVRTFAVGYGAEYFNGTTVDNTDVAKFAIEAVKN